MKNQTLLIVDDHVSMRHFICKYFEHHFNILAAASASDAIHLLEKHKTISAIICDIHLIGTSGYELIEHVRAISFFDNIKIIVLSAGDTSAEMIKAFELGANDYVTKPFNPEVLLHRITNLVSQSTVCNQ